jgi:cytoskeletal protein RodZ
MSMPETPPPGGDQPGRGLSGVQRAGIVLGALAVLLIVFVVLQGGDDSGSDSSTSAQTTATQSTSTAQSTSTGTTSTEDSGTTEAGDDNGSGGSGSDDSGSETGSTEDQPAAPAVQTVNVVNGQPQGGVKRLEATKGDRVRFKVQSDVADEIHVHGYDLMKDVEKGGSASFSFTANIEGRFEIELEDAGTQIAELEVKPS